MDRGVLRVVEEVLGRNGGGWRGDEGGWDSGLGTQEGSASNPKGFRPG